jgi:hypothetical protein
VIIATNHIPRNFDAITIWPFILIRPERRHDLSLITHEMVHYREQRNCCVLPWLLLYLLSASFRLAAEVRGYRAQIAAHGITQDEAARYLMQYSVDITRDQAIQLLANT